MPALRLFTIAISLSAQSAYSFAPQALAVRTQPRAAVALQRPDARVARPLRTAPVFAAASIPAVASPSGTVSLKSFVFRLATALICTLATLLLTASRALAVSATKTAAASAGPLVTGDMIKWGGVALFGGGIFMLGGNKKDTSGFEYVEEEEVGFPQPRSADVTESVDKEPTPPSFDAVSDSAFSSALSARMQQLAEDKPEPAEDEKPDDSTDEWGTGSTAVLEPPRPDAPSVDKGTVENFPVGFPLRDFEEEDVTPAASADDIAMLQRMFSTSKDD